jgi:hypothetical protein
MKLRKDIERLHEIWTNLYVLSQELWEMANDWYDHDSELARYFKSRSMPAFADRNEHCVPPEKPE